VWDAEDLVQETLLRAFGTLGEINHQIRSPRAYLLRTATNLWIDTLRRREGEGRALAAHAPAAPAAMPAGAEARDAAAALFGELSPQERAALTLKEAFDLSLDEIAEVLATSAGAVKAALHRGRDRLRAAAAGAAPRRAPPTAELVDRFTAALRARDVAGMVGLMLAHGSVENVGCGVEYGPEPFGKPGSWFAAAANLHPEWPAAFQPESVRVERALFEGEPLVLCFATRRGREALEQVLRIEEHDGRIARLRGYAFCPETMREVGAALGLEVRTGLYRYPTPAPGVFYREAAPAERR
jgi:RNA polymerase sigma-70 factor (ECF subfamily)